MKVKKLKEDILNAPSHVFGEHAKCDEINYFNCNKKGTNVVSSMQECGLYRDIQVCMNRLIIHIESLLYNMNNNLAEYYNSIVCKFVGGKRINYSKKKSYQSRCEAALISFNKEPEYYGVLHKTMTRSNSPSIFTKNYMGKIRKRNLRYANLSNERRRRRQELRQKKGFALPDNDYGNIVESIPYMNDDEYIREEINFLNKLKKSQEEIDDIERETNDQSSSILWMEERQKRITASNFGKICKMKSNTRTINTIKELLYKKFKGNKATEYGKLNESFAIEYFESKHNVKVRKSGFFIDKTFYFLGANPDGLVNNDAIVEIKCPFNIKDMSQEERIRTNKIKFGKVENHTFVLNRKHNYYFQVQGQLAITKREKCFFVVWSPKGFLVEGISRDKHFWKNEMVLKLKIFYFNCLLPKLVDLRVTRGLEIRENSRKHLRKLQNYDTE
ncbi:uncharacterized protein [Leptinotarsa decemlineata]|uniref:uncharacterized protein n=1 Tax=Leptinotarsa decemlineata TaxID=7539 RepID=UPI003D30D222